MNNPDSIKQTIYRPTNIQGIRSIQDWSDKAQKYQPRKSGNRYQANIEKNGKTYSESFGSLQEAEKWRLKMKVDLERRPTLKPMSFRELFLAFIEQKKKQIRVSTLESYKSLHRHLEFFSEFQIEDINSQTVDNWIRVVTSLEYRTKNKVRSVRISYLHEVDLLRNIFVYYGEYHNEQYINPVRKRHSRDCIFSREKYERRKAENKDRFILPDQIQSLLDIFERQSVDNSKKKIFSLACLMQLRTGMRVGEVFALRWEDVDWQTGKYEVSKTVEWMRTKSRPSFISNVPKTKDRMVIFSPVVLEKLRELQRSQSRIKGLIFSEDGISFPSYSSVQHHYNKAMDEAGIKFRSTHIMRHSFATEFLEATKDHQALKSILGHSTVKMTEQYGKVTKNSVEAGMNCYLRVLSERMP